MQRRSILTSFALAAVSVAALSTAVPAQTPGGPGVCQPGADCPAGEGAGMRPGPGMDHGMMGMGGPGDDMGPGMGRMPMFDFATLDADKDGKVTREEMDAPRQAQLSGIDANGDNLISAEELSALEMAKMKPRADARAAMMIERHDSNNDKMLSAAELAAGPRPMIFDRIDADKDGAITQAEVDAARERMEDRRGDRMEGRKGDKGERGRGHERGHGWLKRD